MPSDFPEKEKTGQYWIAALVGIFGLGIIILIINPVINTHVIPAILAGAANLPANEQADLASKAAMLSTIIRYLPFFLFLAAIIYIVVSSFMKERVDYYG